MVIKAYVYDDPNYGPQLANLKGIRSGWQWVWDTLNSALCYACDGSITVDYSLTDFPASLVGRIILIQGA